jgi:peptidoglycan/xylan/chitin deacetylase (PgdA/CDA1 family)
MPAMSLIIVRKLLKAIVELPLACLGLLLYYVGLAGFVIKIGRRSPRVIMYHACEESESDFIRGLKINTSPAAFAAQLSFFQDHYQIVPLSALEQVPLPDRALIITFDDGLRSVRENAFPLLKLKRLPAVCYLTTDVIGNHSLIWLNELCWYLNRHPTIACPIAAQRLGLDRRSSPERMMQNLVAKYDRQEIDELLEQLRAATGTSPENLASAAKLYLDRADIESMAEFGVAFGNHTGSHPDLARLSDADCRLEIDRARRVLETIPGSVPSLAYPFGRFNEMTRRNAQELGYRTLMEVEGTNIPVDLHQIGRLNVTTISPAGLFAHLEFVAPFKYRLKQLFRRLP